ncbi:DUF2029 domain-containing protein [Corynebacterium kozikiae]|uniref:DUF2029 domain-containing protein n=1 Tax=Corynebacterium kozikiae TaxID=2968469 RepID=UPI00211C51A6|nr:DUF2029 domain-containing protein [Corynebacterium sp. 76QC2CO]MCQ9342506.1 DUF2029 domain-containing protein [Corynebacterium sp. 76QC2CO]
MRNSSSAAITPSASKPRPPLLGRTWLQWLAWVLARAVLGFVTTLNLMPLGDVKYYFTNLNSSDPAALREYPLTGLLPAMTANAFAGQNEEHFIAAFIGLVLLFDAVFLRSLQYGKRGGVPTLAACWFWIVFPPLLAHLHILRLDSFTAVVVGWAAMALFRFPALASTLLAFATTMKLWPGVLGVGLVRGWRNSTTWVSVGTFAATLLALCASIWVFFGADRVLSPLDYQGDRGLQIESVAASPLMVLRYFHPETWTVSYAPSKSFEIFGPHVDLAITITDAATVGMLAFAIGWALWSLFRGNVSPQATLALWIALIFLLLCTNKVFSTQYVLWLGPILAVALQKMPRSKALSTLVWGTMVVAVMSLMVYPFMYDQILNPELGGSLLQPAVLAARNLLIFILTVVAVAWAIQEARRGTRVPKKD